MGMEANIRFDPPLSQVATIREVADWLGVTDQTFYDLRDRWPDDFPKPLKRIGNADVYFRPDLEVFHYEHGYGYGPDAPVVGRKGVPRKL